MGKVISELRLYFWTVVIYFYHVTGINKKYSLRLFIFCHRCYTRGLFSTIIKATIKTGGYLFEVASILLSEQWVNVIIKLDKLVFLSVGYFSF